MQHLQIQDSKQEGRVLSKEQKRFNSLVKKIRTLRAQIVEVKELDIELRRMGDQRVKPAEFESTQAKFGLLKNLHASPHIAALTDKQRERFEEIMLEMTRELLQSRFLHEENELHKMYAYYNASGLTYKEEQEAGQKREQQVAADFMKQMFGLELEEADFEDPAKVQEKMYAKREEFMAAEQARQERKANRKKNPIQEAAEEKRKAAEQAVKKTAKQIYLDLVKHFHPDREQDEIIRAEKTEIMKQITAAYDADDHLQLLELQMTLLSARNNVFAELDNTQLRYFNGVLTQQNAELEREYHFASPEGNGNIYAILFAPNRARMLYNIDRHVAAQKQEVARVRETMMHIEHPRGLKQFVKDFELYDDFDFGPMDFMDMLKGFR